MNVLIINSNILILLLRLDFLLPVGLGQSFMLCYCVEVLARFLGVVSRL